MPIFTVFKMNIYEKMRSKFGRQKQDTIPEYVKRAYKLGDIIGEGATGRVVLAYSPERSEDVAIKIVKVEPPPRLMPTFSWSRKRPRKLVSDSGGDLHKVSRGDIQKELDIWKDVSPISPFTLELYSFLDFKNQVWFVMPECIALPYYIYKFNKKHNKLLPLRIIKEIYAGIFLAVREMHRMGIVHRDIKDDNILLTSNMIPKLADFGLSKRFRDSEGNRIELRTAAGIEQLAFGTCHTAAPEAFMADKVYTETCDTFSLCLSMLATRFNDNPYKNGYKIEENLVRFIQVSQIMLNCGELSEAAAEIDFLRIARVIPLRHKKYNDLDNFGWGQSRLEFKNFAEENMKFVGDHRPTVEVACNHKYMKTVVSKWESCTVSAAQGLKQMITDFEDEEIRTGEKPEF